MRGGDYIIDEVEHEDWESIPSAISTVPGSYTGFNINHIPASTPSRYETNKSNNKALSYNGSESDSSVCSAATHTKYDIKLLKQNQRLLSEVERLVGDIHAANQKNATLLQDAEKGKTVAELEDKCAGLVAENQSQDKALRDAERHLDEGQRRIAELQKRLNHVETDLVDTRSELNEVRLVKKEMESQRDEALHNFNDTQDSLQEYQKKTKEKIKKMEVKEDELQEALTTTTQERDDLLDQINSMEMSLASQEAQINRLLNDITTEDARCQDLEASNQQLKAQLDLTTAQIVELEKKRVEDKEVKKERDTMKAELKTHRTMMKEVGALLQLLRTNGTVTNIADDSGNFSVKSMPLDYGSVGGGSLVEFGSEGGMLAAELNCNNNGLGGCDMPSCEQAGAKNMVGEMRNLVTNMDCEIQRLRCDLKQRDADDRTYGNLRDELKVLMDKVESGMSHNQELECHVNALECDKKNLMFKLEETLGCLEERERTLQCLETRLNERSVQIVCLQEDVDERNVRINTIEHQMHEMEKKMKSDDCNSGKKESPAMKEAETRIKELEAILLLKNKSIDEVQDKLATALRELRSIKSTSEKEIECLQQQIEQKDQDLQFMKDDEESVRLKLVQCQKLSDEIKMQNRAQLDKIGCLSREIDEIKYAKEKMEGMLTHQLDDSEKKVKTLAERSAGLENALDLCRNELCGHLKTMEEIRNTYEVELEQRDACIRKLKEDLRRTVEELKCKMEDNNSLERSLAESRNKVQQICCQLKEADTNIQCLNIKMAEMEKQMMKEKATFMKESEEMERRLAQACANLALANTELDTLKNQLAEKKTTVDCLQTEKTHMCGEIKKLNDQVCCMTEQLKKMEGDNQELCRQLQQKMECIRDLENLIRTKEHELKCITKYIQDKEASNDNSQEHALTQEVATLKEQLKRCREEVFSKSTMLVECEDAFKNCQMLSADKDNEIQLLNCQLCTLNERLQDRVARVEELERGIENLHKDVDRRMTRVDEQLKKYETELVNRIQEIGTLKECVNTCQLNLSEKESEIGQQEQRACRLSGELESFHLKLKDAEDSRDHLCTQLAEKKGEVAELTQQLRLNREQMQSQYDDLVQARQALSCAQRDTDKLRRELDDTIATLEHRECEITRLNDERKNLMEKVACLTCQMNQETAMLKQQISENKCRLEKELECLRNYICQLEMTNHNMSQKMSLTQRQMMQVEKCCHQKLDGLNRCLEDLNTKLSVKEDELMSARDTLKLRDSELIRLKKRLCSVEKPCQGKNCTNNNNNNNSEEGDEEDEEDEEEGYGLFHQEDAAMESESCINLTGDVVVNKNKTQSNNRVSFPGNLNGLSDDEDSSQSPVAVRLSSTPSDTSSTRNSLGVTEVQERLRNNELRQKEIERQLQSLEEGSQDSLSSTGRQIDGEGKEGLGEDEEQQ